MAQKPSTAQTPDGGEYKQAVPVPATRADSIYLPEERQQSGGLDDDPAESGEPVRVRRSHGPLTGGR